MWLLLKHFLPLLPLWVLIAILTGSRDSNQSYREALICAAGLAVISIIFSWFLPSSISHLRYPVQWFALFHLVDRVCQCNRSTTWRIVIYYIVITIFFMLAMRFITDAISQPVEFKAP